MNLLEIIKEKGESTPKELQELTGLSRQYLHRQLNQLTEKGQIRKMGASPMTFYQLVTTKETSPEVQLFDSVQKTISDHFIYVTVSGQLLKGIEAFVFYCNKRGLDIQDTALHYEMIVQRHDRFKAVHHCMDGMNLLKQTMGYGQVHLNQMLFLDFGELEKYGKTTLGTLLHYSKVSQNRKTAQLLVSMIKGRVKKLIERLAVDAVAFIPPTQKRAFQIMRMLEDDLDINLPKVKLVKVNGEISVPQQSLPHLSDRIENARSSLIPIEKRKFQSLLLIDDQVISGATLNEVALKMKQRHIAKRVFGLAIIGQQKGFMETTAF